MPPERPFAGSAVSADTRGVPISSIADVTQFDDQPPLLRSAACSVASCVVAGSYSRPGSFSDKALIETLSGNAWAATFPPLPPDGDPFLTSELISAACSETFCIAVGAYADRNNQGIFYPLVEIRKEVG